MAFKELVMDDTTLLGRLVPPGKTIDEEIIDLQSAFPEAVQHLPTLFEEAVVGSCKNILGPKNSRTMLTALRGVALGNPYDVYSAIDRIFPLGGSLVKGEIAAEFHAKVRSLFRRAIASDIDSTADLAAMRSSIGARLGV